MPAGVI